MMDGFKRNWGNSIRDPLKTFHVDATTVIVSDKTCVVVRQCREQLPTRPNSWVSLLISAIWLVTSIISQHAARCHAKKSSYAWCDDSKTAHAILPAIILNGAQRNSKWSTVCKRIFTVAFVKPFLFTAVSSSALWVWKGIGRGNRDEAEFRTGKEKVC